MTFDDFWKMYPRKVARKPAEKEWGKLTDAEKHAVLQALPAHIRFWDGRDAEYIPHPRTWLHQGRWTDELPVPMKKATVSQAWWTTESATLQYGAEKGVQARPGEDMATYRARLRAA